MILWLLWLTAALVFIMFCAVVLFGAPYVPTHKKTIEDALELLALKKGQTFYDLGCGDGRTLMAAAERGIKAVGYELNPLLVLAARWRTRRYDRQVKVCWGSFWRADLSDADGVFIFLADLHMKRLDKFLSRQKRPLKLASNAFKIPGKKPVKTRGSIYLYRY